jgi:DNA-binding beta-propeller fold protein YncE
VEEEDRSFLRSLVGEEEEPETRMVVKPYGVAINRGRIYICDTVLGGLEIVDLVDRTFDYFQPRGVGQLQKPINCSVDPEDRRLFVTDTGRGQVVVFDSAGTYVGGFGEGEGHVPVDLFVTPDALWVADLEAAEVRAYDKVTFQELTTLPADVSSDDNRLFQPTNLWVEGDRVYVSDFGDFKVKVYDRAGNFLGSVGSYGQQLGQFVRPKGVAVDREGILYVVDAGFENVQVFDPEGNLLMFFGGPYQGPGDMWLPAKVIVDYENVEIFRPMVDPSFDLEYLILVTNQYGPDKIGVYGRVSPKSGGASPLPPGGS